MNINFGIFNNYIKAQEYGNFAKSTDAAAERPVDKKQDNVRISADAAAYCHAGTAAKTAAAEIDRTSSAKIEALREAVKNGTYSVPAEDVAGAILNRMI